jgi:hypothetical protein
MDQFQSEVVFVGGFISLHIIIWWTISKRPKWPIKGVTR